MVNGAFAPPVDLRSTGALLCATPGHSVAPNPHSTPIVSTIPGILLTVQGRGRSLRVRRGRKGSSEMIETVTAVMGLVSAGIFLAHAYEGFRSRA